MLRKFLVVVLGVIYVFCIRAVNTAPVFKGYADRFEIYASGGSAGKILSVSSSDFFLCGCVKGESFKCDIEQFDVEDFFTDFNAKISFIEETKEGISYYAFSEKIKYNKTFNGERINLHVFVGKTQVTVGSPIIFGSF